MSLPGVHASQGFSYQTLVALHWAVTMLTDPEIQAIEIESTSLDPSGAPIIVDDVVVFLKNSHHIYCQCKKNQQNFQAWSFSDTVLEEELVKSRDQLERDATGRVQFFSRNNFGLPHKLVQFTRNHPDYVAFQSRLTAELKAEFDKLLRILNCPEEAGYALLRRLEFRLTPDFDSYAAETRRLLGLQVNQADSAFDILYSRLDQAAAKFPNGNGPGRPPHRFTREDLIAILARAGIVPIPPYSEAEILGKFHQASGIGRHWKREIGGKRILRTVFGELTSHIESKAKTILITDEPGCGKTCLLLDLVDALEAENVKGVLFIQSREFSDCASEKDLSARGLPMDMVGHVARLAEYRHTIVIIDSLDVLSLNRGHGALRLFLTIIDRLERLNNVTTIAACRNFDLKYDPHLAGREWNRAIRIGPLDWKEDLQPLLEMWRIPHESLAEPLRRLIANPRHLALFEEIVKHGSIPAVATTQELTSAYLDTVVTRDEALGQPALNHLCRLAAIMMEQRRLDIPTARAKLPEAFHYRLLSAEIIFETSPGRLAFAHQTLMDALAVQAAESAGQTLLAFIQAHPAVPFLRPAVRAFFFYLRFHDPVGFRRQIRAVFEADDVAFHLKRLIAESLAEISPKDEDWPLVRHLFNTQPLLFERFFGNTKEPAWLDFFITHWLPDIKANRNECWARAFAHKLHTWMNAEAEKTVAYWREAFSWSWINIRDLAQSLAFPLDHFEIWNTKGVRELFEVLVAIPRQDHDFLGHSLSKWIEETNSGDDLLWRYISSEITPDVLHHYRLDHKLHCQPHEFHNEQDFLRKRMAKSETLLNLALDNIENWSKAKQGQRHSELSWYDGFLRETSWGRAHSRHTHHYVDGLNILLDAIEFACLAHARENSPWWRMQEPRLRLSPEGALRYFALVAYKAHPESNLGGIQNLLHDAEMLRYQFEYEIGQVIHASFSLLDSKTQATCQQIILSLYADELDQEDKLETWVLKHKRDLISWIPAWLRLPEAQALLDKSRDSLLLDERHLHIFSISGGVGSPISADELLSLSDRGIIQLLGYYAGRNSYEETDSGTIGGENHVIWQLQQAASLDPERFLMLLNREWPRLSDSAREAVMEGTARHMRYRFGEVKSSAPWDPRTTPSGSTLAQYILDTLEASPCFWRNRREAAYGLQACAELTDQPVFADRVTFLLFDSLSAPDPRANDGEDSRLLDTAINSTRGIAAEAAITLATGLAENGAALPGLLPSLLFRFASDPHQAVRAAIVNHLPLLQHHLPELGWAVFDKALSSPTPGLWATAERCLYYGYAKRFDKVSPFLARMEKEALPEAGDAWGRIATLASIEGHVSANDLFAKLRELSCENAWVGAIQVYSANLDKSDVREACIAGLENILAEGLASEPIMCEFGNVFRENGEGSDIPFTFVHAFLTSLSRNTRNFNLVGFVDWLARFGSRNPESALPIAEKFADVLSNQNRRLWIRESFFSLLTTLFREADDRDDPAFLDRVVHVQDVLLKHDVHGLDKWLAEAERP